MRLIEDPQENGLTRSGMTCASWRADISNSTLLLAAALPQRAVQASAL